LLVVFSFSQVGCQGNTYSRSACMNCVITADNFCVGSNVCVDMDTSCSPGDDVVQWPNQAQCPPELSAVYIMYPLLIGTFFAAFLLAYWCASRPPADQSNICSVPRCRHQIHHIDHPCTEKVNNTHSMCVCATSCRNLIPHCGRPCYSVYMRNGFCRTECECIQCTCRTCQPQCDCYCSDCRCEACRDYKFHNRVDCIFKFLRIPFGLAGIAIFAFSCATQPPWIPGIVWGLFSVFISIFGRRRPGWCCKPKDLGDENSKGKQWDDLMQRGFFGLRPQGPLMTGLAGHFISKVFDQVQMNQLQQQQQQQQLQQPQKQSSQYNPYNQSNQLITSSNSPAPQYITNQSIPMKNNNQQQQQQFIPNQQSQLQQQPMLELRPPPYANNEEQVFCSLCGRRLDKDARFCSGCGKETAASAPSN